MEENITVATSQIGWKKSFGTHGVVLDGENVWEVLHGRLIIIPDGPAEEKE